LLNNQSILFSYDFDFIFLLCLWSHFSVVCPIDQVENTKKYDQIYEHYQAGRTHESTIEGVPPQPTVIMNIVIIRITSDSDSTDNKWYTPASHIISKNRVEFLRLNGSPYQSVKTNSSATDPQQ